MSLEIKWDRSPWWYARYVREGRKLCVKLDVRIEGVPPASKMLSDSGDALFEKSRAKAELRFSQFIEDLTGSLTKEDLVKRVIAIRRGGKKETVLLTDMFAAWHALPRKKNLSKRYVSQAKSWISTFVSFVAKKQPSAKHMADVEVNTAEEFMALEENRGSTPKTYNDWLILLRSVFKRLKNKATLMLNPFEDLPLKESETIGQSPFSTDDLAMIIKAVMKPEHDFIRPIVIAVMCTAMRRGDCCRLKWADVDPTFRFIVVKTAKKGRLAIIPIFPLLQEEIRRRLPRKGKFVFPEAELQYSRNPDHITDLCDRVLTDAGFFDADTEGLPGHRGNRQALREKGLRKARVHGMHSFRVTWVTLALTNNVPMELVRRVTSHQSVEVVLKCYFKPGQEALSRELTEKMPRVFTLGSDVIDIAATTNPALNTSTIRSALESMTDENWHGVRDGLLDRLKTGS